MPDDVREDEIVKDDKKPGEEGAVDTVRRKRSVQVLKKERPVISDPQEPEKPPVKRVAAYCRVSTDKEEQKTSIKTQVESFRTLIDEHPGWELVDIYTDEGISGTQALHRDSFNRMMDDCRAGKIDRIITKSISRFARNTVECLSFTRELKTYGVYVYFEKEKLDTESEVSEMALSILAAVAQEESRSLSDNVKWGTRKRFAEGKPKWTPTLGYKKEGDEDYVVDPETAPIVRRIFDEYVHGKSLPQIIQGLDDDGITGALGGHWYPTRIDAILSNEKYIGDAQCQKTYTTDHLTHKRVKNDQTVVPGYYIHDHHEPIIDRNTFEMVQKIRSMKDRHKGPVQYPYKDLIKCPVCGKKLVRGLLPKNDAPPAWHCAPDHGNTKCAGYYIKEKYIDEAVKDAYRDLDITDLKNQAGKRNEDISEAAKEAIRMKREMPELESVEYYFLDAMVKEIRLQKWDTAVIMWKCGLKSEVPIRYEKSSDIPFSKEQRALKVTKEWRQKAEETVNVNETATDEEEPEPEEQEFDPEEEEFDPEEHEPDLEEQEPDLEEQEPDLEEQEPDLEEQEGVFEESFKEDIAV